MLRTALTAALTAACCFAVAAATGLGASAPKAITMKLHQIIALKSDNFHCQAITKTEVACGANSLPNSIQVYFTPHQVNVLKFNKAATKAQILYATKR